MALTVTDAWKRAVKRKGAQLRYLAIIEDGTNTWKCFDASHDSLTYPVGLAGPPSTVGSTVDPITRKSDSISEVVVDFRDKYLRPIVVSNRLKGQAITIKFGAAEIDESDFCYYGSGVIDKITGDGTGQVVTVQCLDAFSILKKTEITGSWADAHPLEILYKGDGTGVIERCGVPDSLVDTTAFDPSSYTTTISHFNMCRAGFIETIDWGITEPTSGLDIINEIATILNGTFLIDSDGKFTIKMFDSGASAAEIPRSQIRSLNHVEDRQDIVNQVTVGFWRGGDIWKKNETDMLEWVDNNTDSQTNYEYKNGGTGRIFSHVVKTSWNNSFAQLVGTALPDDADVTFDLIGFSLWGFCGMRNSYGQAQPAECKLSAARPGYFMIRSLDNQNQIEIIKVESMVPWNGFDKSPAVSEALLYHNEDNGGALELFWYFVRRATIATVTRGVLGTVALNWSTIGGGIVHDITMIVAMTEPIIARLGDGIDIIEVNTPMSEFEHEVGDLVAPVDNEFVSYGNDGLDGSVNFEIIQKEPRPEDEEITFTMATAATGTPTRLRTTVVRNDFVGSLVQSRLNGDVSLQHFVSGGESTTVAGLAGKISAGVAWAGDNNRDPTTEQSITYPASKDTYITYSPTSKSWGIYPVPNSDPAPDIADDEMFVAKVVTGAAAITSHTDLRPLKAMNGSKLVGLSVDATELAAGSVIAGKIATGGVSAAAQLASAVVTEPKVASSAVNADALQQTTLGKYLNSNARFSMWET